jgi:hypothetical protein
MHDRTSRDSWWLRDLNATLKVVVATQVAFLLFVGMVVLGIVFGIVSLAMNR